MVAGGFGASCGTGVGTEVDVGAGSEEDEDGFVKRGVGLACCE